MKTRIVLSPLVFLLLAFIAASAFAGIGPSTQPNLPSVARPSDTTQIFLPIIQTVKPVPAFKHIYIIVMENQFYSSIIGSQAAPYINSLALKFGLATNYQADFHPSEPNYMALFSGSNQGVIDDGEYNVNAPNVADQIEASGRTWRSYAEDYPGNCSLIMQSGNYVRRHVPALNFLNITQNAKRCANVTDMTNFDPTAADFEFITPNLIDDMHDGGAAAVANGDAWLSTFVPKIITSDSWLMGGSVLFIVWDEDATYVPAGFATSGGNVPLLVIAPNLPYSAYQSSNLYDHYSLLRTIQNAWSLGCLANTCQANDLSEFFQ